MKHPTRLALVLLALAMPIAAPPASRASTGDVAAIRVVDTGEMAFGDRRNCDPSAEGAFVTTIDFDKVNAAGDPYSEGDIWRDVFPGKSAPPGTVPTLIVGDGASEAAMTVYIWSLDESVVVPAASGSNTVSTVDVDGETKKVLKVQIPAGAESATFSLKGADGATVGATAKIYLSPDQDAVYRPTGELDDVTVSRWVEVCAAPDPTVTISLEGLSEDTVTADPDYVTAKKRLVIRMEPECDYPVTVRLNASVSGDDALASLQDIYDENIIRIADGDYGGDPLDQETIDIEIPADETAVYKNVYILGGTKNTGSKGIAFTTTKISGPDDVTTRGSCTLRINRSTPEIVASDPAFSTETSTSTIRVGSGQSQSFSLQLADSYRDLNDTTTGYTFKWACDTEAIKDATGVTMNDDGLFEASAKFNAITNGAELTLCVVNPDGMTSAKVKYNLVVTYLQTGTCGDGVTWTLAGEGDNLVLTVSKTGEGTGEMYDYDNYNTGGWYDRKDDIRTIVVEDGVTTIGDMAFQNCGKLASVTIPNSVTDIKYCAFAGCGKLTSVTIGNGITSIGPSAFGSCTPSATITLDTYPGHVVEGYNWKLDATVNWLWAKVAGKASPDAGGTVAFRSGGAPFRTGTSQDFELEATARNGYSFLNWTENGNTVGTDNLYRSTAASDRTLTANFGLKEIAASVTGWTGPYDGQGHGVEVAVSAPEDGSALRFALGDASPRTNDWSTAGPMFTNVCRETVWVEISAEGYATATNRALVAITNAPLTITAKDQTYVYNGQPQGEGDPVYVDPADIAAKVDVAGLAAGDALSGVTMTGHRTEVGVYAGEIQVTGATITNAAGAVVTGNYAITFGSGTLTIEEPPPPSITNVVARQRWPWNGCVDVDYEIGGDPEDLAELAVEIVLEERGGEGRRWVATNFLADAEPSAERGSHRATWDAVAAGVTNAVAPDVVASVALVRPAAPAEAYPLWVGGVRVASDNREGAGGGGGAWFYSGNATNGTLTLHGATITETYAYGRSTASVFADEGLDLTIALEGSNTLANATGDYGVFARGNLTIAGGGVLVAEAQEMAIGANILRIDGAIVAARGGVTSLSAGDAIEIANATVTATGASNCGINCRRISIEHSAVTAAAPKMGIVAVGGPLSIRGASSVTAEATDADGWAVAAAGINLGGVAVTEPAPSSIGASGDKQTVLAGDPAAPARRVEIEPAVASLIPTWIEGPKTLGWIVGDEATLPVALHPAGAGNVEMYSRDESIIELLSALGPAVAKAPGTTFIDVYFHGAGTDYAPSYEVIGVSVWEDRIRTTIDVGASFALYSGESASLGADLVPSNAGELDYVSGDGRVVTVDEDGTMVATGVGDAEIEIRFSGNERCLPCGTNVPVSVYPAANPLGDANLDGAVDVQDAVAILAGVDAADRQRFSNADANRDHRVDRSDADLVLAFYAFRSVGGTGTMEDWIRGGGSAIPTAAPAPAASYGGGGNAAAATSRPALTVTVDGETGCQILSLDEARGRRFDCTIDVSGADRRYCSTGFHVYYSDKLDLVRNDAPTYIVRGSVRNDLSCWRLDSTGYGMQDSIFCRLSENPDTRNHPGEFILEIYDTPYDGLVDAIIAAPTQPDVEAAYKECYGHLLATTAASNSPARNTLAQVAHDRYLALGGGPVPNVIEDSIATDADFTPKGRDPVSFATTDSGIAFAQSYDDTLSAEEAGSAFDGSVRFGDAMKAGSGTLRGRTCAIPTIPPGDDSVRCYSATSRDAFRLDAIREDFTAPAGMKGFFVTTTGVADDGADGTLWRFSFTVSDRAKAGDVLPIDIACASSDGVSDRFTNLADDADGRNMEAYLFTKGIYTPDNPNPNPFGLAGLPAGADAYIAIKPLIPSAVLSDSFRLDTRKGPFESDGTETLAFSSLWHGTDDSSVAILANGEPVANGLSGESNYVWRALVNGTNVLTHVTVGVDNVPETATFIVKGLYPEPSATLRWKYAKNANGWFCAQVALRWHPAYADAISNMRLLFADRYEYSESRVVIETLDEEQAAFFQVPEMVKLVDSDGYFYFMNAETGDIYTEDFLRSGYKEVLNDSTAMEDPNYLNGKQVGSSSTFASQNNDDTHTYFDENGVLTSEGTGFQTPCVIDGHTVTGKLATTRGLRLAYLVDPATVAAPLEPTVTFMETRDGFSPIDPSDLADLPADAGTTYRVSPIDLSGFANLAAGDRAVFGVSDETMASPLASVPKAERKICLRVVNRQLQTVDFVHNKIAWLAWEEGGRTNYLPLVGSWASSGTEDGQPAPQPGASFAAPLPQPAPAKSLNLSESFGLPLAAVATAEVTCRIASMGFGADGSAEGTFEIAAEDAGRVVAESGELAPGVKLAVLGAASLGGSFEPLDPAACGVELLSRKPPYAFRVKAPGPAAFFKVRLEAEDLFE